jgi:hypothetical protein
MSPAQATESERLQFPAMIPREREVWRAWLKQHQSAYDRFDYNVRVGPWIDPGPAHMAEMRQMAKLVTQKRIDAVGYQGSVVTLFEVKVRAGLSSIGQLLGYEHFWQQDNPLAEAPRLALVVSLLAVGLQPICDKNRITVYQMAVDFSAASG